MTKHEKHNVVSLNEHKGEYNLVHEGILYCRDCQEEFVPNMD